jgi:WD40 repeat protein
METKKAIVEGTPSPAAIANIVDAVADGRQERRLHRIAWRTAAGFCLVVIAAGGITFATWQLALSARDREHAAKTAEANARRAEISAARNEQQARHEAERQTANAKAAALAAAQANARQQAMAHLADLQKRLASALALANDATVVLEQRSPAELQKAALLAARAMIETKRLGVRSLVVDQAARQVLDLMPAVHNPLAKLPVRYVLSMSAGARFVAVDQGGQLAIVNLQTERAVVPEGAGKIGAMRSFGFSGDGSRFGAAFGDSAGKTVVRVWDAATGNVAGPPIAAPFTFVTIALDFTGDRLAFTYLNDRHWSCIQIWSATTGTAVSPAWESPGYNGSVAFSPKEALIATFGVNRSLVWRWSSGTPPFPLESKADAGTAQQLLFMHDGTLVTTTFEKNHATIARWSLTGSESKQLWRQERESVRGVALAPDDSALAVWDDRAIALYSGESGVMQKAFNYPYTLAAAVAAKSWYLAIANAYGVTRVIDLANLGELDRVVSSPLDQRAPVGMAIDGEKVTVATLRGVQQWGDVEGPVTRMDIDALGFAYAPDEDIIAVLPALPAASAEARKVAIYDAERKPLTTWAQSTNADVAIAAASQRRVLIGDRQGTVRIYTPAGALPPLTLDCPDSIWTIAVSRSSEHVAVTTGEGVYVWNDWSTPHSQAVRLPQSKSIDALAFGATDDRLVTGSLDGKVQVWDWRRGQILLTMRHGSAVFGVSVNRAGTLIASAGQSPQVNVWNAQTGTLQNALPHDAWAMHAAFDPSGEYLATIAADNLMRIWRIGTGSAELVSRVPYEGISSLNTAFSPSGRIVTFGGYLTMSLWKPEDLIAALCQRVDCTGFSTHDEASRLATAPRIE